MAIALEKHFFSTRARRTTDSPISWLMRKAIEDPEILSLAAGFVDTPTLPDDLLRSAVEKTFSTHTGGKAALQYGATIGLERLRSALAQRLRTQGIRDADHRRIMISNGGQQSLQTITEVLVDEDDVVLVEDPTYFVYMDVLRSAGAHVYGVETDEQGMVPEALAQRLEELHEEGMRDRLKILYVMSYFQNPTGANMSLGRRQKLFEIFQHELERGPRFVLLEDACYHDLGFDATDEPYIKSFDEPNGNVITLGTFSKAFAPGLRLGWSYMPEDILINVLRQKGNQDFGSSNMNQTLMAELLESGAYDNAAARFRERYRIKRDALIAAIREFWPPSTYVLHPHGGLYVWVRLPGVNTNPGSPFFEAVLKQKVLYVPGFYCYCQDTQEERPDDAMRLCYGVASVEAMREAVRRMGPLIEEFRLG